jgi:hypothetical protein
MNKLRAWLAAIAVVAASVGTAVVALPQHRPAEAAAYDCTRYRERHWGYIYCDSGKSLYWTEGVCIRWIGDLGIVDRIIGNLAKPGVDASVVWCPDGFRLRRMIKHVI